MTKLEDVIKELETAYPPERAESWDAVGLVSGDPAQPVRKVLFAVDPVPAVAGEAIAWDADLIVTHHPLWLRGTTSVATTGYKGRLIHDLIKHDIALYTAHTNADVANPGVSDALARAVGLVGDLVPLQPFPDDPWRGLGRIGDLPTTVTLESFARAVLLGLPETNGGIKVAGDPQRRVRRIAVSGGAGDSLLGAARKAGVDVFLTADLRHHPASEFAETGGPALIDAAHWATEWPWLGSAASILAASGVNVETRVSATVTDAWTRGY
ncbi:Nif3-like dinuclear metal center hexameric protein [Nonomuraea soli]|uniref:GTP cyclohydrolase 1 type 2 homolog n=1 Tax=Nonomuraea soli TaxID=1032476 RepID=A0A7W0CNI6_9ACTN|nr:Nif3-like dinuclear metal center hexameric protein [Nonomuraea soli]MBA2894375.1 dinuclear metal center YbgI/SA1388 family protein [Nonomuraea soli]